MLSRLNKLHPLQKLHALGSIFLFFFVFWLAFFVSHIGFVWSFFATMGVVDIWATTMKVIKDENGVPA